MKVIRTQVGIIGGGPAGLLLSQLLMQRGIESVVLELRDRNYVESRIRAGVLEQGTVQLLCEAGVGQNVKTLGQIHDGIEISLHGQRSRIDLKKLSGGKAVTVYGQTEITKDLITARLKSGGDIKFEVKKTVPLGITSSNPKIRFEYNGENYQLNCDFIAGCDGFHGISRTFIPKNILKTYEKIYPHVWLGILAEAPPPNHELIYTRHPNGFALFSMRPPTRSRTYLQFPSNINIDEWPDSRIWDELRIRIGAHDQHLIKEGPVLEKNITSMRSFVAEPIQFGHLFLAGDSAHIVPPTGAKGLNLAASDIRYLSWGLFDYYDSGSTKSLNDYSKLALSRVWKAERFSWWMTSILHNSGNENPFEDRIRTAELEYLLSSKAAMTSLAENYVGLPF